MKIYIYREYDSDGEWYRAYMDKERTGYIALGSTHERCLMNARLKLDPKLPQLVDEVDI